MEKTNKDARMTNFEVLRLFAMLMILAHHFALYGFKSNAISLTTSCNSAFTGVLLPLGKLGVALFLMITGYFLVNSTVKVIHFFKIYFQTWSYSVLFLILAIICSSNFVSLSTLKRSILPFTSLEYWFITFYLILYMLIPFINKFLVFIRDKNWESYLLGITTIWFLFIHTNVTEFIYLYILGAYIKQDVFPLNKIRLKYSLVTFVILLFLLIIYSITVISPYSSHIAIDKMHKLMSLHSPFILAMAISIFMIFKAIHIKTNKIINYLALSTFSIYLIHENPILRPFLWSRVFGILNKIEPSLYCISAIISLVIIFIGCIIFDKLFRQIYIRIQNKIITIINKVSQ